MAGTSTVTLTTSARREHLDFRRCGALALQLTIGAVLLVASASKLQQPYDFLSTVYSYRIVDSGAGLLVAQWVPHFEFVTGVLLVTGVLRYGALLAASGFFLGCTALRASIVLRGLEIPCGCFAKAPTGGELVSGLDVLTSAGFLAGGMAALYLAASADRRRTSRAGGQSNHRTPDAKAEIDRTAEGV